ncbi:MAG: hypothetical protein SFU99_12650 [Saprospiraceae bacterium]|nr:hypothetical protein [Saprospiraceae bacterium]
MRYYTFFLFLILLANACQSEKNETQQAENEVILMFFDLKGYFNSEVKRLNQEKLTVSKKVAINGENEEKTLNTLDFAKELDVFIKSDINRPDWTDKYEIDSTLQDGKLTRLQYQALNEKLRTREIFIEFANNQVQKIHILNGGNSIVAGSQQELTYLPKEGYTIKSRQYTMLSKDKELSIEVRLGTNPTK